MVAAGDGRAAAPRRESRGRARRRRESSPPGASRHPIRGDAGLDHVDQWRAPLPQGIEPRSDPHGARRGHVGGGRARCRPRGRRGPRSVARARPHRASRAVRRGRQGRAVALAGHAAAVGLRAERAQAGDPASAEGRRSARAPPIARDLVRPQRPDRGRRRPVSGHEPEAVRVQVHGRAAASDVQSQRARPRREGSVRERRRHSSRRRPLWGRAAPAEARRHRHARVLRLVQRRRTRLRSLLSRASPAWLGS